MRGAAALLLLLLAACLPTPASVIGKKCDGEHQCPDALFCVEGFCRTTQSGGAGGPGGGGVAAGPGGASGGSGGHGGSTGGGSGACQPVDEVCSNGRDDDCDGAIDCLDSDCGTKPCDATNAGAVCCASQCVDTTMDPQNCGGCGAACVAGKACRPYAMGSLILTGRCDCASGSGPDSECPSFGEEDQRCNTNVCLCDDNQECAPGQRCLAPGVCTY